MPLLALPNELLLLIAEALAPCDLFSLLRTTHHFSTLLTPLLHTHAARETTGHTALFWAAEHGHDPLVRTLLLKSAPLSTPTETALHWAAQSGTTTTITLLLDHGADINALVADNTETPLFWAVRAGNEPNIRLLLARGAKVNNPDPISLPLPIAIYNGQPAIARLLLDHGAEYSKYDSRGKLPLHWAAAKGDEATLAALLEMGASVDSLDRTQFQGTALHYAAGGGHLGAIDILLGGGAEMEARALETQATPFHLAALLGQAGALGMLLERGANARAVCEDGSTALHLAASGDEGDCRLGEVIGLLLVKGADVNAKNRYGDTPLREPVMRGCKKIVKALIVRGGADVFTKDIYGDSVLDEAEKRRDFGMARLLIRYGVKGVRRRAACGLRSHAKILYYMARNRKYPDADSQSIEISEV